ARLQIALEPFELLRPEIAQAARLQVEHVDERHEMDAALIEAVPAILAHLAEALEIRPAIVDERVVLAGNEMRVELGGIEELLRRLELFGLREMADIAGVQHHRRP